MGICVIAVCTTGTCVYPYLVSLPHDYNHAWDDERKWPAILFLHGMDERGSDLAKVRLHGIPKTVLQHKVVAWLHQCKSTLSITHSNLTFSQ